MFHCKLIDGFYVLRAVNIRICQVGERERVENKRENTESTERPSCEGNSRSGKKHEREIQCVVG